MNNKRARGFLPLPHHDGIPEALQNHRALHHVLNALATHTSLLRPRYRRQMPQQQLGRLRFSCA